jgi:hypothetical protein
MYTIFEHVPDWFTIICWAIGFGLLIIVIPSFISRKRKSKTHGLGICPNCGQSLDKFPVKGPNQRCPTKEEIKLGHYK